MEETRFMQEFPITLKETPNVNGKLFKKNLVQDGVVVYDEVYEWRSLDDGLENAVFGGTGYSKSEPMNEILENSIQRHLSRQFTILEDTLYLCDCGGHNHYILLNSLSFTRKSIFMVTFKATDYHTHGESYHQLIGCHIETIIGKDPEACILLVGSWWDAVEKDSILKTSKGVDGLFVTAAKHIKDRVQNTKKMPMIRRHKCVFL